MFEKLYDICPLDKDHGPLIPEYFIKPFLAVIYRNWETVPAAKIAETIGTTEENITLCAKLMGLTLPQVVSPRWLSRGYLTVIRANWHILPYDQLMTLLSMDQEHLSFLIKEEDFLYVKLGFKKPDCPKVIYSELTDLEKQTVRELFSRAKDDRDFTYYGFDDYLKEIEYPVATLETSSVSGEVRLSEGYYFKLKTVSDNILSYVERFSIEHKERFGISLDGDQNQIIISVDESLPYPAESFLIRVNTDIEIVAKDEFGVLQALNFIEAEMAEKRRPYLTVGEKIRKTAVKRRIVYSFAAVFGDPLLDEEISAYPEGLLYRLSKHGVNGVWIPVILYNMAPVDGYPAGYEDGFEARIRNLNRLCERAAKFGIKIYVYLNEPRGMTAEFYLEKPEWRGMREDVLSAMCTSNPEVLDWLYRATKKLFTDVPALGGTVLMTMSENITNCYSRAFGKDTTCPICAKRTPEDVVSEVIRVVTSGVHDANPDAAVLAWTWGERPEWYQKCVALFPSDAICQGTSEDSILTNIGGIPGRVEDYTMSIPGPSERTKITFDIARSKGMETSAKVQVNTTWQCPSVPSLPVLETVYTHIRNHVEMGTDNLMLSWTLGGYPTDTLLLLKELYYETDEIPSLSELLKKVYQVDGLSQPIRKFSEAFSEFPFSIGTVYMAPWHSGPANLIYPKATTYTATMVAFGFDDIKSWCDIYPTDIFINQLELFSKKWQDGLALLDQVEDNAQVKRLKLYALATYVHLRSICIQTKLYALRNAGKPFDMELIQEDRELAKKLLDIQYADDKIGFEATNHYYYNKTLLLEKLVNCDYLLYKSNL